MRTRAVAVFAGIAVLTGTATIAIAFSAEGTPHVFVSEKAGQGDPDAQASNGQASPGLGATNFDAYMAAERTYPANVIPPAVAARAEATFGEIAAKDAKAGDPKANGHKWKFYGPRQDALEPGGISFTGATNSTASPPTV